jgi:hypothetical protein
MEIAKLRLKAEVEMVKLQQKHDIRMLELKLRAQMPIPEHSSIASTSTASYPDAHSKASPSSYMNSPAYSFQSSPALSGFAELIDTPGSAGPVDVRANPSYDLDFALLSQADGNLLHE